LVQDPSGSGAHEAAALLIGRALYAAGLFEQAADWVSGFLDRSPSSAPHRQWLLFLRAQARHSLLRSGRTSSREDLAALALGDYAACLEEERQGEHALPNPYVLFNIADLHRMRGAREEALREFGHAAEQFAAEGSWREEILAYAALEDLHRASGAWSMCHRIVTVAQRTGDALTMGETSESLGMLFEVEGKADSALEAYNRGLEVYRVVGNPYQVAELEGRIGAAFRRLGEADSARAHFARQIALAQALHSEPLLAKGHFNLGLLMRAEDRLDSALVHFNASLEQMSLIGDRAGMARVLNNLGAVYHQMGDSVQAARFYGQSIQAAEEQGETMLAIRVLLNMGDLHRDGQDYARAAELYDRALNSARAAGDSYSEALSLFALGLLRLKCGRISEGYGLVERAVRLGESVAPEEFMPQRAFLRRLQRLVGQEP